MVLSLPMALISISLSQVYLQHQAERIRKREFIRPDFIKVSGTLLLLSLPLAIILILFAQPLFTFLFGPEWRLAGQLTGVLIFGQTLKFVVSPLSSTLVALQEVRFSAIWQILYFAAMLWLYVNPGQDIQDFVWRYCLVDLIAYSCYYGLIYNRVKHYEKSRV
jgi:O-antigen/teichoic acid export membrane protein